VQKRWFASAAALLIVVPAVATAQDPVITVLDLLAEVWARGEVGPLDAPPSEPNRTRVSVVGGHNVYVVLEINRSADDDADRLKVNLTGFIECHYTAEAETDVSNPIAMIRGIYASFSARCRAGDTVVVYPSSAAQPSQSSLFPAGPPDLVAGPDGRTYAVQPLAYETTYALPDGRTATEVLPAWSVPLTPVRDVDGRRFNFIVPDVLDAIEPYGTTSVRASLLSALAP